jgi:hypothetical protein
MLLLRLAAIVILVGVLPLASVDAQDATSSRLPVDEGVYAEDLLSEDEGWEEEEDEIETDRDSFTPATTVAGFHRLIAESAWSYIDNRAVPDTNSLPELIARYGVNDWLELRLGWNWEAGGAANSISSGGSEPEFGMDDEIERDSQLNYGVKVALTSQSLWRPQTAAIIQAGTPTFGKDTATALVATYAFGWELPNRWKWDSAVRYSYDSAEGDHFNIWAPSTVLKIPVAERWTAHAEYFGILSQGHERERTQHYISPGIHYLVTPNFEVGVRFGWGMNDQSANFFSNAGIGWRY